MTMGMQLDFSGDFQYVDNWEVIQWEATRRATVPPDASRQFTGGFVVPPYDPAKGYLAPNVDTISTAFRFTLDAREAAASAGAYQVGDLQWMIPIRVLSPGTAPSEGDVFVDLAGIRYTIISVNFEELDGEFWIVSRNLTIANNLKDVISIERPSMVYDPSGVPILTFPPKGGATPYQGISAKVQLISQESVDDRLILGMKGTHQVIVDRQVAITYNDRVKWGKLYLDIIALRNPERIDELPVLDCEIRP